MNLIDQDISLALGKPGNPFTFNASEAIVVTFNNIQRYANAAKRFKYQVIIATDYTNTFAILNYDRVDEKGRGLVGYGDPGPCRVTKRFSSTSDDTILTRTSNVGRPGKHIHLLTVEGVDDCVNRGGK